MRACIFAIVVLLVAGCDAEEVPPMPDPERAVVVDEEDPCGVVTSEEMAEATGGRAGRTREAQGHSSELLCSYPVGPPYSTVTVHVETDVSEAEFRRRMERDPINTERLQGVGDLAFTHGLVAVSVWEDGRAVSASVQHFSDPARTEAVVLEIGELIDSKL